jgi:uncharacterized protein
MDIKDKLAFYKSNVPKAESIPNTNIPSSVKALANEFRAEICRPAAPYLKIRRYYDLNENIMESDNQTKVDLTFLNKGLSESRFKLEETVFFDLETTGLMGGTGTFPFLMGFAAVKNNQIKIDQYFLPDFGREFYAYKALNEFFPAYKNLVSFNGKSYDYPLLNSRYIMNHLKPAFSNMHHFDLLHMARRVWKDTLPACDLISIEQNVLNRYRSGDIPGWLIPQSYFDFLNTGVIHNVIQIIEHNFYDIISLVELVLALDKISNHPENESNVNVLTRLANEAYHQDNLERFEQICNTIEKIAGRIRPELLIFKSILHKRRRDWNKAVLIWETLSESGQHAFFALEELAKFHEHQRKNYQLAMTYTTRALKAFDLYIQLEKYTPDYDSIHLKFRQRYNRLKSKLA